MKALVRRLEWTNDKEQPGDARLQSLVIKGDCDLAGYLSTFLLGVFSWINIVDHCTDCSALSIRLIVGHR